MIILFSLLHWFLQSSRHSQPEHVELKTVFYYGDVPLIHSGYIHLSEHDSIRFDAVRLYISGIELTENNRTRWKETDSYHLVDLTDTLSQIITLEFKKDIPYDAVKFNIGIDSITNCSGAKSGDLDPAKGMYWTWQSGYINLKIEGKSNLVKKSGHEFQYHIGGYSNANNALASITLPLNKKSAELRIDLSKLISSDLLVTTEHIMSPGKQAVELSRKIPSAISIR